MVLRWSCNAGEIPAADPREKLPQGKVRREQFKDVTYSAG